MNRKFSSRLGYTLKLRNKRAVDLSRDTGLSQALISQYMNDKFEPKNDKLSIISEYLNVNPLFLMGWVENPGSYDEDFIMAGADDYMDDPDGFLSYVNEPNPSFEEDQITSKSINDKHQKLIGEIKTLSDEQLDMLIVLIKGMKGGE